MRTCYSACFESLPASVGSLHRLPVARSLACRRPAKHRAELFLDRPWRDQTLAIRPSGSLSCSMDSSVLVLPSRRPSFFLRSTCFTFSLCDAMWLRRKTRGT